MNKFKMQNKIEKQIKKISDLIEKIKTYENEKKEFQTGVDKLNSDFNQKKISEKNYKKDLRKLLKRGEEKEQIEKYDDKIINILKEIKNNNNFNELFSEKKGFKFLEGKKVSQIEEKKLAKEFVKSYKKEKSKPTKIKYIIYKTNFYNVFANRFFGNFSKKLIAEYPKYFKDLQKTLRLANLKVFSNTYISVGILTVLITIISVFILSIILFRNFTIFSFVKYIALSLLLGAVVLVVWYYYPRLVMDTRRREIKADLPFAIIHMAAVAGSGAQLPTIFSMLLESKEYKGLEGEIKRIMNYINLLVFFRLSSFVNH